MIKLNCDLGESYGNYKIGNEETIMPLIDMANIACGFHAGDPLTLQKSVELAKKHNVEIGSHPAYPDLVGFGRRSLKCSFEEIEAFTMYQCGALSAFGEISYVKPHGALYNDMMKDDEIFKAILSAIKKFGKDLKLMILSTPNNSKYEKIASGFGISLLFEVFADRAYTNDGFLVPRTQKGAVLHSSSEVVQRLEQLQTKGSLNSIDKKEIFLQTDSLCVHGDNPEAIKLIKLLRENIK